jgi:AraC-like DNA-binding protein
VVGTAEQRVQITDEAGWLDALSDPRAAVHVELFGYQSVLPSWHIGPRTLPEHLIYFVVEHACEGSVQNIPTLLEPGAFMWLAPDIPHEFHAAAGFGPVKLYNLRFRLIRTGVDLRLAEDARIDKNAWELHVYMQQTFTELRMPELYHERRLRALLILLSSAAFGRAAAGLTKPRLNATQRLGLVQYVEHHLADQPTSGDLAAHVALSPDYFSRVFRWTFGVSPRTWLKRERIRRAAMMLTESHATVTEVARALGYHNVSLFSRQFKEITGASPRAYREGH